MCLILEYGAAFRAVALSGARVNPSLELFGAIPGAEVPGKGNRPEGWGSPCQIRGNTIAVVLALADENRPHTR